MLSALRSWKFEPRCTPLTLRQSEGAPALGIKKNGDSLPLYLQPVPIPILYNMHNAVLPITDKP